MFNFEFLFLLLLTLPFLFLPLLFKKTILELKFREGLIYPLIFYKALVFVIPAYLIVQFYGVNAFPLTFIIATDQNTFPIGLWIIYSLYIFFITLSLSLRFISRPSRVELLNLKSNLFYKEESLFLFSIFLTSAIFFLIGVLFLGHKHAFIYSLMTGESLIRTRLDNSYFSSLPSQISYIFSLSSWLFAIYAGRISYKKSWFLAAFSFLCAMFLASIGGDKAPLLEVFFLFFLGRITVKPILVSKPLLVFYGFFGAMFTVTLLFFVVGVQMPELTIDQYLIYLADRAGVGQMAGTYESFSITGGLDGGFFWHIIPFASFFVDYPIYDKELMVFVENVEHTNMGVKNSLFISEAFGIGGYALVLLSPIIVGASYAITLTIFYRWLSFLYGRSNALVYFIPISLLSMNITGGFSSFPLLKGCILNMILIAFFFPFYSLLKLLLKPQKGLS